jgi:hypothetical protein
MELGTEAELKEEIENFDLILACDDRNLSF